MKRIRHFVLHYRLGITRIFLIIFFACFVILPLLRMLFHITADGLRTVFSEEGFGILIWNSLLSAVTATVITLILSYLSLIHI